MVDLRGRSHDEFDPGECEDRRIRLDALGFKIEVVPAIHRAAFRPDPLLSVADVWPLSVQLRNFVDGEDGRELFGEYQERVREMRGRMGRHVEVFLAVYDSSIETDRSEITQEIEDYAREYPLTGREIGLRGTAIEPLAQYLKGSSMGAFKAVGTMVESLDDLSDRLAI